jgi:hypothetical protein
VESEQGPRVSSRQQLASPNTADTIPRMLHTLLIMLILAEAISAALLLASGVFYLVIMIVWVYAAGLLLSAVAFVTAPRNTFARLMLCTHLVAGIAGWWTLEGSRDLSSYAAKSREHARQEQENERARIGQLIGSGKQQEAIGSLQNNKRLRLSSVQNLATLLCSLGEQVPNVLLIQEMRAHGARDGELMSAASLCSAQAVRTLLSLNVPADARTHDGFTALMVGTNVGALRLLLERGANVQGYDWADGMTPLMFHRTPEVTKLLLHSGAKPNTTDKSGRTALHHVSLPDHLAACFELLLQAGANPNIREKHRQDTPLHVLARGYNDLDREWAYDAAEVLVRHKADPFAQNNDKYNTFDLLLENNENLSRILSWPSLDLRGTRGSHVLNTAIRNRSDDTSVRTLLRLGANPGAPDEHGRVPMQELIRTLGTSQLEYSSIYLEMKKAAEPPGG